MPRWENVGLSIWNKSRYFVTEAGKIILIISIILWFLASFAPGNQLEMVEREHAKIAAQLPEKADSLSLVLNSEKLKVSYAGHIGRTIEPAIRPLGFDWKIGIALVSSFAAREVFTGTMGVIFGMGNEVDIYNEPERQTLTERVGREYSSATAFSLVIFYAFAMQCMSTLAVTKRETGSWKWTFVMLVYMTGLAYLASFIVYQVCK
jgi:ferrous iron transport protein B